MSKEQGSALLNLVAIESFSLLHEKQTSGDPSGIYSYAYSASRSWRCCFLLTISEP